MTRCADCGTTAYHLDHNKRCFDCQTFYTNTLKAGDQPCTCTPDCCISTTAYPSDL